MIGSEPMMPAEDFASVLMARILAFIILRSRSTLDRLDRASDRLPPVRDWIAMTMAKKLASASGTRSGRRDTASSSGRPRVWSSTISWNSLRTGSWESLAMTFRQSISGRPALTPRTMTSTALGNSLENRLNRRLRLKLTKP